MSSLVRSTPVCVLGGYRLGGISEVTWSRRIRGVLYSLELSQCTGAFSGPKQRSGSIPAQLVPVVYRVSTPQVDR